MKKSVNSVAETHLRKNKTKGIANLTVGKGADLGSTVAAPN